jgi:hypothetical protein
VHKSFPEQKKLQSGVTLKEGSVSQKPAVKPWLANTPPPQGAKWRESRFVPRPHSARLIRLADNFQELVVRSKASMDWYVLRDVQLQSFDVLIESQGAGF